MKPRILFKLSFKCLLLGAGLFLFRASFSWPAGWLYLGLFTAWTFLNAALLARYRPELLEARLGATPTPATRADRLLSAGMGEFYAASVVVCAVVPGWKPWAAWSAARWGAFALIAACYALSSWSLLSNASAARCRCAALSAAVAAWLVISISSAPSCCCHCSACWL